MRYFKGWISTWCLLKSVVAWAQAISYELATGVLTIPSVSVGGAMYDNVTLQNVGPGYTFAPKTAKPQVPPGLTVAIYDLASGAISWTDGAGKFWLFGGSHMNDLWEYWPIDSVPSRLPPT